MSVYQRLLDLAREQSAAVARGDLEAAVRVLGERASVMATAAAAGPQDAHAIREILRRDRDLSGAIRQRMIDIRNRAARMQRGRVAMTGYGAGPAPSLPLLDTTR